MTAPAKLYDAIRDSALNWSQRWFGNFGEIVMLYIFLLPDLVRLMINLLADSRVFILDKIFVAGVLIYIISPIDVFPEILIGPFGLVEDFILALIVLYRLLSNPYNTAAIQEHWKGDPNVMAKIQQWSQYIRMLMQKRRR
jgi:uncharacterized membrane protein YkvA (DUF1232 family)